MSSQINHFAIWASSPINQGYFPILRLSGGLNEMGCVKALWKLSSIMHSQFVILFQYIWNLWIGNYFKCHVVSGMVPPTSPVLPVCFPFWMKRGRREAAVHCEVQGQHGWGHRCLGSGTQWWEPRLWTGPRVQAPVSHLLGILTLPGDLTSLPRLPHL